jgi:metal-dependent amidase/aminoacylase/carboxypeptidase family protein
VFASNGVRVYVCRFDITVKGKGGHGAMPAGTVDAIVEAAAVVTSLQTIVSRNVVCIRWNSNHSVVGLTYLCGSG